MKKALALSLVIFGFCASIQAYSNIIIKLDSTQGGWIQKNGYIEQTLQVGEFSWLKYSTDGKYLFSNGKDSTLRKWDSETGILLKDWTNIGDDAAVDCDSERVFISYLTNNFEAHAKKVNMDNDFIIYDIMLPYPPYDMGGYSYSYYRTSRTSISPDNKLIALFADYNYEYPGIIWDGKAGNIGIWDNKSGNPLKIIVEQGKCNTLAFSPDSKLIAYSVSDSYMSHPPTQPAKYYVYNTSRIVDINFNNIDLKDFANNKTGGLLDDLTFSSDSKNLAATYDNSIYQWNLDGSIKMTIINLYKDSTRISIWELAPTPNPQFLLGGCEITILKYPGYIKKNSLVLWHLQSGRIVDSFDFSDSIPKGYFNYIPDSTGIAIGCQDGKIRIINPSFLSTELKANFISNRDSILIDSTVKFFDISTGKPTSWLWFFGDGATSIERNPEHTYTTTGNYTIKLIVSDGIKKDTIIKNDYIVVLMPLIAEFESDVISGQAPLTVYFSDKSSGYITSRLWRFGDGDSSETRNPVHIYKEPGMYSVSLTIFDFTRSSTITKTDFIEVVPATGVNDINQDEIIFSIHPNPFSDNTTLSLDLKQPCHIKLSIYDFMGNEICTPFNSIFPPGHHEASFVGRGFSQGFYFCTLKAGDLLMTKKIMIQR